VVVGVVMVGHMNLGEIPPAGRGPSMDPLAGYFLELGAPLVPCYIVWVEPKLLYVICIGLEDHILYILSTTFDT
jgi:hypothetical protein